MSYPSQLVINISHKKATDQKNYNQNKLYHFIFSKHDPSAANRGTDSTTASQQQHK